MRDEKLLQVLKSTDRELRTLFIKVFLRTHGLQALASFIDKYGELQLTTELARLVKRRIDLPDVGAAFMVVGDWIVCYGHMLSIFRHEERSVEEEIADICRRVPNAHVIYLTKEEYGGEEISTDGTFR